MENRFSWQKMAVALFDKATARLGEDARQLQDAMFWLRPEPLAEADSDWELVAQGNRSKR